eukprot:828644-Prymnesium_polylepis.1
MSDAVDGRSGAGAAARLCGKTTLFYRSHPAWAAARRTGDSARATTGPVRERGPRPRRAPAPVCAIPGNRNKSREVEISQERLR